MTVTTLDTSTSPLPFAQGGNAATSAASAYINLLATRSISGVTTLDSTDFGKTIICGGAGPGNYDVTLPPVSAGKTIRFIIATTGYGNVSLQPASGTIQGFTFATFSQGEGCEVYCDGTNWFIIHQTLNGIYASISDATGGQTITGAGPYVQIHFDTVISDPWGFYNTGTFEYVPLFPGRYQAQFFHRCTGSFVATTEIDAALYINGSAASAYGNFIEGTVTAYTRTNSFQFNTDGTGDAIDFRLANDTINMTTAASSYILINRISNLFVP